MKDLQLQFKASLKLVKRPDNSNHNPGGYDLIMTFPDSKKEELVYSVSCEPDGKTERIIAAIPEIPEMLDRLGDHCEWCADCDWQHDPDQTCRFGQLWKKLGGVE